MVKEKQIILLKNQLINRRKQLTEGVSSSQSLLKELLSESFTDDTDYAEISSDSHNMSAITNNQRKEINEIDIALKKIENKTYGVCDMCGEEIGIQRLKAKPHAIFCVHCRPIYEQSLIEKNS
ncbi:MAG: RNA polymerase-binding protein DksA [Arcobacteraceae bacterium]